MYRRADAFVGEVLQRLDPGTPVMIVSDHGFHSFRWSVNLNTWLVERGYMVLQGQVPGEKKLDDLFGGGGTFWENVDWSRTRAYAMGLGQIYVNLQGREGKGIVPEREYDQLLDSLIIDLMSFLDPHHAGSRRGRASTSAARSTAARTSTTPPICRSASKAAIARRGRPRSAARHRNVIEPNMKKWSGDHGSSDYKDTAGYPHHQPQG